MKQIVTWKDRREGMKAVCRNCHNDTYIDNFYVQYDSLVTLYNEKFAVPSKGIIDEMTKQGLLNPKSPFGDPLQWTFYELWHHEGRRARHGASMMGPRLHALARHVRGGEALLHQVPAGRGRAGGGPFAGDG